ncbi:ubiquitin-conjugating enzyme E2 E1 [Drosophila guanche]|uniref:E2 ubiquitin-conjugating enzyme n=1 Tax=Drosophila guanche TaxID=7266 RepID=A0A3B0J9F2_DROGU|nr:ubiquitin-conjugating enzyme E2 E1 [Drosophila guanche]SPP78894.1 blast:Ubiquitin-conjugating enzyme E2 E3 [Drosophila guanche]
MSSPRRIASKPDIASASTSNSSSAPTMPMPNASATPTTAECPGTTAAPQAVVEGSRDTLDTLDCDNAPNTSGQRRRFSPQGADCGLPVSTCAFRVRRELNEIRKNPPPNCSADLFMDRLLHWTATVIGPAGSVYEGGHFELDIRFPLNYPFRPPRIRFSTLIYHCNVDCVGAICLDVLNERWSPVINVSKVLLSIWLLLGECNPEDPLVMCIAEQYKTNRQEHDKVARFWTKRFAMPKEAKSNNSNLKEPHEPAKLTEPKNPEQQNSFSKPM